MTAELPPISWLIVWLILVSLFPICWLIIRTIKIISIKGAGLLGKQPLFCCFFCRNSRKYHARVALESILLKRFVQFGLTWKIRKFTNKNWAFRRLEEKDPVSSTIFISHEKPSNQSYQKIPSSLWKKLLYKPIIIVLIHVTPDLYFV